MQVTIDLGFVKYSKRHWTEAPTSSTECKWIKWLFLYSRKNCQAYVWPLFIHTHTHTHTSTHQIWHIGPRIDFLAEKCRSGKIWFGKKKHTGHHHLISASSWRACRRFLWKYIVLAKPLCAACMYVSCTELRLYKQYWITCKGQSTLTRQFFTTFYHSNIRTWENLKVPQII